jgi:hypothetical protein
MQVSVDGAGVEIYFSDLTLEAQRELLELMGVSDARDLNWDEDLQPIAIVPLGSEDELDEKIDEEDDENFDEEDFDDDDNNNEDSDEEDNTGANK